MSQERNSDLDNASENYYLISVRRKERNSDLDNASENYYLISMRRKERNSDLDNACENYYLVSRRPKERYSKETHIMILLISYFYTMTALINEENVSRVSVCIQLSKGSTLRHDKARDLGASEGGLDKAGNVVPHRLISQSATIKRKTAQGSRKVQYKTYCLPGEPLITLSTTKTF